MGLLASGQYNWRLDYTEYDYIDMYDDYGVSMQHIKTPATSPEIRAEFKLMCTESWSNYYMPIIVREFTYPGTGGTRQMVGLYDMYGTLYPYGSGWVTRPSFPDDQWADLSVTIRLSSITVSVDGVQVINDTGSGNLNDAPAAKWTIYGLPPVVQGSESDRYPTDSQTEPLNGRYQKILIYDANTEALLSDLRPVMRNVDGKVGLYDVVNEEFCMPENKYGDYVSNFTVGNLNEV